MLDSKGRVKRKAPSAKPASVATPVVDAGMALTVAYDILRVVDYMCKRHTVPMELVTAEYRARKRLQDYRKATGQDVRRELRESRLLMMWQKGSEAELSLDQVRAALRLMRAFYTACFATEETDALLEDLWNL